MKWYKRFAAAAFLSLASMAQAATTAVEPTQGNGTDGDPYQISTLAHLKWLSEVANNTGHPSHSSVLNAYYIQTADIDASDTTTWDEDTDGTMDGFDPIGKVSDFTGVYDGRNHTISNLFINRPTEDAALFDSITGATIKNLSLAQVDITSSRAAGMVVHSFPGTTVNVLSNLAVSGSITAEGGDSAAGIINSANSVVMMYSSSSATITSSGIAAGLAVDFSNSVSKMENCLFSGTVTADTNLGGLVISTLNAEISNCVNRGSLSGLATLRAGISIVAGGTGVYQNLISAGDMGGSGNSIFALGDLSSATLGTLVAVTDEVGAGVTHTSGTVEQTKALTDQTYLDGLSFDFINVWEMSGGSPQLQNIPYIPWAEAPAVGDGTELTPYQISTLAELIWITENSSSWDKYFVLTADIDALVSSEIDNNTDGTPDGLSLIGNSTTAFTGHFDGAGFAIKGLTVDNSTSSNDGIFGIVDNTATIQNASFTYANTAAVAPAVGDGTESNPYQISNLAELRWVTDNPSSWGSHFVLTADIYAASSNSWDNDADGIPDGFGGIGNPTTPFTGNFDGAGFSIQGLASDTLFGNQAAESVVSSLGLVYATASTGGGLSLSLPQQIVHPGDVVSLQVLANGINVYGIDGNLDITDDSIVNITNATYEDYFAENERLGTDSSFTTSAWDGALTLKNPALPQSGGGTFATLEFTAMTGGTTRIDVGSLFSDQDGTLLVDHSLSYYFTVIDLLNLLGLVTYQSRSQHDGIEVFLAENSIAFTDTLGGFNAGISSGAGNYTLKADAAGFLPVEKSVTLGASGDFDSGNVRLPGGDCNDDDTVDIGDLTQLLGVFRNTGVSNAPGAITDINLDSQVNIQDLAVLGGNYELSGVQTW